MLEFTGEGKAKVVRSPSELISGLEVQIRPDDLFIGTVGAIVGLYITVCEQRMMYTKHTRVNKGYVGGKQGLCRR